MNRDELIYLLMLVLSLPAGYLVKNVSDPRSKKNICSALGVMIVVVLCGLRLFHSLVAVSATVAIIKVIGWRKCHLWSFVFNFSYITFFRAGEYFGLGAPTSFSNVVQLLLTLKLVGVAFEIHDTEQLKEDRVKGRPDPTDREGKKKYIPVIEEPTAMDIFHYSYCFVGILTGPYFKYKTYHDMINNKSSGDIPTVEPMLQRAKQIIPIGAIFLLLSKYFSVKYMTEDAFFNEPFWFRLGYMVPAFMYFRMRMYCAWILAECVCIIAGLGAYPTQLKAKCGHGPLVDPKQLEVSGQTPVQYDFETIHNISAYQTEFTSTFRDSMRWWNMTVQWWLKTYIFIRFPIKSVSTLFTMLISAYWHGIYAGYYMSLLTVPFILYAEDLMIKGYRTEQNKTSYDWLNWIFRMRGFEYLSLGFLLLYGQALWNYWTSIYFIGHIVIILFIVVGTLKRQSKKRLAKHLQVNDAKVK